MSKSAREMRTKAAPPTATENVPSSFFAVFTNLVKQNIKKKCYYINFNHKNTITTCCESDTASSRPTSRGGTKQTPGAQIRQLS
jgi:hypothetical protein